MYVSVYQREKLVIIEIVRLDGGKCHVHLLQNFSQIKSLGAFLCEFPKCMLEISFRLLCFFSCLRARKPQEQSHKITELFSSYIIIYIHTYSWCAGQMSSSFFLFPSLNLYAKVHFNFRLISSLKAGKVSNPNPLSTVHCTSS